MDVKRVVDRCRWKSDSRCFCLLKGTSTGVLSDINGYYSIEVENGQILEYRFVGFETEEKLVKTGVNGNLRMRESV